MTQMRAEIVRALRDNPVYMLRRLASAVPAPRRHKMLTGTKLVRLVGNEEQEFEGGPAISGVAAAGMIEAGYLVEVKAYPRPFGGRLYMLSEKGKGLVLMPESKASGWDAEQGGRIFRRDLDEIAAEYGAKLSLNTTRHWWELTFQVEGEATRKVTLTDAENRPIARLGDLDVETWRKVIAAAAGLHGISANRHG